MGISRTPDGNTGWKVTAACQWRTGGRSRFPSQFCSVPPPLPSPSSVYPLTLTHSYTLGLLSQSKPLTATALLQSSLLVVHDDTLRGGGQAGACLCHRRRPRQGAEESAEVARVPSDARQVGRQPPATSPDLQQWAKGATRAVK